MNIRDYLIFSVGLITGGLIIGIRDIYLYNKEAQKSLKKLLRGPTIYSPTGGIDIKRGIHFRGKIKGMSRKSWPPPSHGGGPPEIEYDKEAKRQIDNGKSADLVWSDYYYQTFPEDIQNNINTMQTEKTNFIRRMKYYQNSKG
jgi:hypothetical protein